MRSNERAVAFAPGEFIKEELAARGWRQEDLAEILGRSPKIVSEIVSGRTGISPETAEGLGSAFGTTAQLWMNLDAAYRLAQKGPRNPDIARRAEIYARAPIRAMVRRHWIEYSRDVDVLERNMLQFFEIDSLDEEPGMAVAARKATTYDEITPPQKAWLFRAKHLAAAAPASSYSRSKLTRGLKDLRSLVTHAEDIRHVPRALAELGIRLLVVEPLPRSRIDGACFWLDSRSPVVVLSARYDRIDWFWFTLMHELLGHVLQTGTDARSSVSLDLDLVGERPRSEAARPDSEKTADRLAADFLVPKTELDSFIARVGPFYSRRRIEGFANRQHVHPGIVVGQLQHRGIIPYTHNREMLVRIRSHLTSSALTDGWGCSLPARLQ
jgi:HTH-type transcriptional regulator/antitoxin HigA